MTSLGTCLTQAQLLSVLIWSLWSALRKSLQEMARFNRLLQLTMTLKQLQKAKGRDPKDEKQKRESEM